MFSGLKKIKLEVNNKDTWKILKCLDIKKCTAKYSYIKKEIIREIRKIILMNENESRIYQTLVDAN